VCRLRLEYVNACVENCCRQHEAVERDCGEERCAARTRNGDSRKIISSHQKEAGEDLNAMKEEVLVAAPGHGWGGMAAVVASLVHLVDYLMVDRLSNQSF
jgi:hypothetical protein